MPGKGRPFEKGNAHRVKTSDEAASLVKLGDHGRRARQMTQHLISALNMWDEKQGMRNLEVIIDQLVAQAKAGEMSAIVFVWERVEGKMPQAVVGEMRHTFDLTRLSDDELRAFRAIVEKAAVLPAPALIDAEPGR